MQEANSARHAAQSFAYGFVEGEPHDAASLAGTALGDLFVFGDIRDAVREGSRLALGEKADTMILGLACVGLAITAGTYATLGAEAPARIGLSLAKAARKTGRLSADLAASVARMLRGVVDWGRLKSAIKGVSMTRAGAGHPRRARGGEGRARARGLVHLAGDVGTVQAKAGTRAALDGLELAQSPREMSRIAKTGRKGRRQDPRHPQARRPRRHHADRGRLRSRHLDHRRAASRFSPSSPRSRARPSA